MRFNAKRLLLALVLASMTAVFAVPAASADTTYHVGDHIEAYDTYTSDWQTGVIFLVEDYTSTGQGVYYKARIDGGPPKGSSQDELLLREDQIRPISTFAGQFKLGSTVDTAYGTGDPNSRGEVIAVDPAGKRYKVHYPGCNAKRNEWLDQSQVKVPEKMSAAATRFLAGKWIMFTPSYLNTVIHDSQIYREYGTGAHAAAADQEQRHLRLVLRLRQEARQGSLDAGRQGQGHDNGHTVGRRRHHQGPAEQPVEGLQAGRQGRLEGAHHG
jgi:hypothetical protein